MRTLWGIAAAVVVCAVATSDARAQADGQAYVHEYQRAKLQVTVPAGWEAFEPHEDQSLNVYPPDGSLSITISPAKGTNAKKVAKAFDKMTWFEGLMLSDAEAVELNGLSGFVRSGAADLGEKALDVIAIALKTPRKKIIQIVAWGIVGEYEVHAGAFGSVLASVSPFVVDMPQAFYDELAAIGDKDMAKVVRAVMKAIDSNDAAALSKHIAKSFYYFNEEMSARAVKKAAKGAVAEWLGMPAGEWRWEFMAGPAFEITRGDWAIAFYDEATEDRKYKKARWRISSVYLRTDAMDEYVPND